MRISIGIPTYNRPDDLRRTLECILSQTYMNLEIIISDNCSANQDVEKIVNEFIKKDNRIKYYRQSKNMGVAFNYNFVLQNSSSDYFMWLADDDELGSNDYIEALVLEINKGYDFVFPNIQKYYLSKTNERISMPTRQLDLSAIENCSSFEKHFAMIKKTYIGYQLVSGIFKKNILTSNINMFFKTEWYKNIPDEGFLLHFLLSRYNWSFVKDIYYQKDMTKSQDFKNTFFSAFFPTIWHFIAVAGSISLAKYKNWEKIKFILVYFFRSFFILLSIGFYDLKKRFRLIKNK